MSDSIFFAGLLTISQMHCIASASLRCGGRSRKGRQSACETGEEGEKGVQEKSREGQEGQEGQKEKEGKRKERDKEEKRAPERKCEACCRFEHRA